MSILDAFTIIFEADTSKLKDGLKDANTQAYKLNNELAQADANANKATTSIGSAFKAVAALAAGFIAAGAAKASFAETVEELNNIGRTADSLGLAVEDVDAFSRALVAMGGDAQGARDSLMDMAESIGEAITDVESGRAKAYAKLGITLKDVNGQAITATEGMLKLADAVSGMSKDQAVFNIKQLGITDNRTVELILKGRQELERMLKVQKEQSAVNKEAIENARKYTEATSRLQNAQSSITTGIVSAVLPAFTKIVDLLAKGVEWARENKDFMVGLFGAIAAVVLTMYLPAMISAAAATLAATWPIVVAAAALAALATAFALVYDDIMNFIDGNDSLIGQIFENFPGIRDAVMSVVDAIKAAWNGISSFVSDVLNALMPLADAFGGVFSAVTDTIGTFLSILGEAASRVMQLLGVDMSGAFHGLGNVVSSVMNGIVATIRFAVGLITKSLALATGAINAVGKAAGAVAGFLGVGGGDKVAKDMQTGKAAINQASSAPLNGVTSNAISNSVASTNKETNVQVGEVKINTQATDSQGIARDVGGGLKDQLSKLDSEFSTGVDR